MISTRIIGGLSDVPSEWIFEHYLNLSEKLIGQDVKMFSVFKTEKTPSMFVYFKVENNQYRFKDFSSGKQGDKVTLIMELFNLTYQQAINKICSDYERYLKDNSYHSVKEYTVEEKFKVTDYEMRHWTNLDAAYWTKFKISSKLLDYYNVAPLSYFTMGKINTGENIVFKGNHIYGYFKDDGTLYKIYMPKNTDKKFIKVQNYIQGSEQLTLDKQFLVITSSLKDLMCFTRLGYKNAESIAPDSENSMIPETTIKKLKKKYENICVLFDNDEAGKEAAEKYKERYGFNYVILNLSKDLSDSVKDHGIQRVKEELHGLLSKALKK